MKRLLGFFAFCFLFVITINSVLAVSVTYDYLSSTNGQTSTNGTYYWDVPAGVTSFNVTMWGAGGNGGNGSICSSQLSSSAGYGAGGGGGSGAYGKAVIQIPAGVTKYFIIIGGGSNQNSSINNGTNRVIEARNGGSGGNGGNGTTVNNPLCKIGGPGGLGGKVDPIISFQMSVNGITGQKGEDGYYGCSGVGVAGLGGNGSSASNGGSGGLGGQRTYCSTGPGVAGQPGGLPGAGGGGGTGSSGGLGALGGKGRIIIDYNLPVVITPTLSCSKVNQTIFSLYDESNSNVSLWDDVNAGYKICYEQIFGKEYAGLNPHACNIGNTNKVLKISALSNALAEKPDGTNYNVNVCYGEMSCSLRSNCIVGEKVVVKLASQTASLVSNSTIIGYTNLLCCSEKPLGFNSLSWKNSSENAFITNAKKGDSVKLYATTNLSAGSSVNFDIYEYNTLLPNSNIRVGSNALIGIVNASGVATATWTITDADFAAGGNDNPSQFYYVANNAGFWNSSNSPILITANTAVVINSGGQCDIDISSGVDKLNHRGIYFVNKNIEFNQTKNDNVVWTIDDNGVITTNTDKSFVKQFTTPGQKTITLTDSNIVGCGVQTRQISILVVASPGLLAFINTPFDNQVFQFDSGSSLNVLYSANDSYVVDSVLNGTCGRIITCFAGNCPTQTSGTPETCPSGSIAVTNNLIGNIWANINFTWSKINGNSEIKLISGKGNVTGIANYDKSSEKSNAVGDKQIKLIANYTTGLKSKANLENIFLRSFTIGTCIDGGKKRLNIDSSGRIINISSTISTNTAGTQQFDKNACGDKGDGIICCPSGWDCSVDGCKVSDAPPVISCSNYTSPIDCNNDPYSASGFDYGNMIQNGLSAECNVNYRCSWSGTSCSFNITQLDNLGNFGGSCLETAFDNNPNSCADGATTHTVNISSTTSGTLSCLTCQNGVYEVPCGKPVIELPFFGVEQLVLSLISIVGLYLLMFRRELVRKLIK